MQLSADQNITGKISFLNNIYVNGNFDSQYINNVDVTNVVSLNDDDSLIGEILQNNFYHSIKLKKLFKMMILLQVTLYFKIILQ